jgi:hypothetical protein
VTAIPEPIERTGLDVVLPLASWSAWTPFLTAAKIAPVLPGVYLARSGADGPLVYVGHAGERSASQPGIRGRLGIYARGKGAVSGLGEAVLDRALAEPAFVLSRLTLVEEGAGGRAKDWATAAMTWADVHLAWAVATNKAAAHALEQQLLDALRSHDLWNRQRPR